MSLCKACHQPLILQFEPDSEDESLSPPEDQPPIPDDLHLPCSCHFHWQCLLDQSPTGMQENLNILPHLTEESHLLSHPSHRPARALHTLSSEGDTSGLLELLADADSDPEITLSLPQLLSFRDPLNNSKTALHVALENTQEEIFWLLLWLASGVHTSVFPEQVVQSCEGVGLPRRQTVPKEEDLRFIPDGEGSTPGRYCVELGGAWKQYAERLGMV
ncbi:hypothetical protein B0T21DRAFT_397479 [Apiosordaria backusii]|uniref:Uncharacterized protein n=1 Tax=Apiosordaria backusii TaxID=314023 RepID=A0AA40DIT4_9PEZI|nr:hypothetical protein B0T21DRAFT_397479 [Apiosordaria backusii]